MIERLTNCPSCGGTLNEAGRCEFCGSKVFDFLTISLMEGTRYIPAPCYPEINLDLMVIGDMIQIDDKGDND